MDEAPVRHPYRVSDRAEVFDFIREVFPAERAVRKIAVWTWKYETQPFATPEYSAIDLIRIGPRLVGLLAGFRLPMCIGGIECIGEARGDWMVHPDYRGHDIFRRMRLLPAADTPVRFGWSRLPPRVQKKIKWLSDPVRPLIRVLDAGAVVANFTRSQLLGSATAGASVAAHYVSRPFHRKSRSSGRSVMRLDGFDERADALWKKARRADRAMVVRDRQYLNWRYCQRPDAAYLLYGLERASELDGFLVARVGSYRGMRWGYVVDFLTHENSSAALGTLIGAALDEFRGLGVAGVTCYATDDAARGGLFRNGFFPVPQRQPDRFVRFVLAERTDLAKFMAINRWYVTMGDGDFEFFY